MIQTWCDTGLYTEPPLTRWEDLWAYFWSQLPSPWRQQCTKVLISGYRYAVMNNAHEYGLQDSMVERCTLNLAAWARCFVWTSQSYPKLGSHSIHESSNLRALGGATYSQSLKIGCFSLRDLVFATIWESRTSKTDLLAFSWLPIVGYVVWQVSPCSGSRTTCLCPTSNHHSSSPRPYRTSRWQKARSTALHWTIVFR